jgi:tetratricopeptide (TPR) repeat protein
MYLTVKQQVKHLSKEDYRTLRELCHTAKNLANEAVYNVRQYYFAEGEFLKYEKNYVLLKNSPNYKALNSNMAQQILKEVDGSFKSFFGLLKLAKQGKYAFKDCKLPHYLPKDGYTTLVIGFVRLNGNKLILPFSNGFKKTHKAVEITIPPILLDKRVKEIHIIPKAKARFFEIQYVYEAECSQRNLNTNNTLALVHNNHAVEHLLQGEAAAAAEAIAAALALDAGSATLWSNAGVIHARAGRRDEAERAYLRAISLQRDHIGALANLVGFHRAGGDAAQLAFYEKRLQRAQALDPFSQFLIGQARAEAVSRPKRSSTTVARSACCPTNQSSIAAWRMPTRRWAIRWRRRAHAIARRAWRRSRRRSGASAMPIFLARVERRSPRRTHKKGPASLPSPCVLAQPLLEAKPQLGCQRRLSANSRPGWRYTHWSRSRDRRH